MPTNRRQFLQASFAVGASLLLSERAKASSESDLEEKVKRQRALYTLRLASPYPIYQSEFIPHMHVEFKSLVERFTNGKVYVDIHHNGVLGSGRELMAAVTRGQVEAILISVSNLSRAAPALDILNIPFWASANQAFLNLICSPQWQSMVIDPINQQGKLTVLIHHIVGARTLTSTKHFNRLINLPEKLEGVVLRVPASKVLHHFYNMTPANVVDVPWAKVAKMARTDHIDVMDPSVIGLFAGPDKLRHQIAHVSLIESVPDAWVTVANQKWLNNLPNKIKLEIQEAGLQTFRAHVAQIEQRQQRCKRALMALGAKIYHLNEDEKQDWQQRFGHHNAQWNDIKRELLGSTQAFQQLVDATQQRSSDN
ncbi:TRAP transporter substrate-binding protein DctP [Pseudoalteromonas sp. J010]|uniref:TRAP transporter substrate-binding protein n=1 Tax=Pseudoalteromonas sp. J010 TaxID=998465 RepID=UPI000F646EB3|nr:TRAP transporter substrate-binding protein DctP [Pseudoalteromonas sp. J010]RRS10460.1 TRAP transporter substrate-binding protein DctP [Pseudoalteromonas sp. J010]